MDPKQKRTTILALLLAGVVGFATLRTTVTDALLKPVRDLEKKLAAAQRRQESLGEQKFELDTAKGRLDRWRFASLPPDPDTAQRFIVSGLRSWLGNVASVVRRLMSCQAVEQIRKDFLLLAST